MSDRAQLCRLATSADIEALTDLRRRLAQESEGLLPCADEVAEQDTRRFIESDLVSMFVFPEGERLVGTLGLTRGPLRRNAHVARLWVGVTKERWGRGIGEALMHAAFRHASTSGISRIELSVREDNTRALALYRRLGMEVEGRRPRSLLVDQQFHDELWLSKLLPIS